MGKKKNIADFVDTQEINQATRSVPANIQAEQMLLGAIMINNESLSRVSDFLKSDHFYEPIHGKLYNAIVTIIEKGISASPVSLKSVLLNDTQFEYVGGGDYLKKLTTIAMTVVNARDYGSIIYDLAMRRSLIRIGEDMINNAYLSGIDKSAFDQIEYSENKLFNLASEGIKGGGYIDIRSSIGVSIASIEKSMKNSDHITGITTGFLDLDKKLLGFHNSDLLVIAGRPSMGKTAFAINLAINAAKALLCAESNAGEVPKSVGFFSLEMSAEQLTTRILSMYTNINSSALRSGRVDESQYNILRKQAAEISSLQCFIDDTPALSISSIRTRARRMKRKNNLGIIFIDYLQLIKGSSGSENRALEISEITQGLKALAKELNIPIIALSQLSRAVEQREDKRPMLSDLRESGAIEQDADIVMFIYREEYYITRKEPEIGTAEYAEWQAKINKVHNLAEIIVAKHRNGPVGTVELFYDSSYSRFGNYQSQ